MVGNSGGDELGAVDHHHAWLNDAWAGVALADGRMDRNDGDDETKNEVEDDEETIELASWYAEKREVDGADTDANEMHW